MPTIVSKGCSIHVEIEGPVKAPALILSNSLGTNLHMWDEQAKALSKKFRVIRYDQRGHGKSGAPKGPYTIEQLGTDVLAILDKLEIKKANFCGLSMGGTTGMWVARNAPERINKLILSNTGARIGDPVLWNTRIRTVLEKGMSVIVGAVLDRARNCFYRSQDVTHDTSPWLCRMLRCDPRRRSALGHRCDQTTYSRHCRNIGPGHYREGCRIDCKPYQEVQIRKARCRPLI
jgi:3-oxoadipate enol-lactonase